MTAILERPTLVLNRHWQPVGVAPVARALVLLWNDTAHVIDPQDFVLYTWEDWADLRPQEGEPFIQAVRQKLRVPEVVTLSHYDRQPAQPGRSGTGHHFLMPLGGQFPSCMKPLHWTQKRAYCAMPISSARRSPSSSARRATRNHIWSWCSTSLRGSPKSMA